MRAEFTAADCDALIAACERDLGDPASWTRPSGYPASLALCVIDAVFCIGVRYQAVAKLLARYRTYRSAQAGDADTDGIQELLDTFARLGGPEGWAAGLQNRQRTSTSHGILKADAVLREAHTLAGHGVESLTDLRAAGREGRLPQIMDDWCAVPGQRSGASWGYLLLLADIPVPGVQLNRMTRRYVTRAVGAGRAGLSDDTTAGLVSAAARAAGWDVVAFEHAIWKFESGR